MKTSKRLGPKYSDPHLPAPTEPCPNKGKMAYSTRKLAKADMRRFTASGKARQADTRLHVFRCVCGRFHIGHLHRAIQAGVLRRSDFR